MVSIYLIEDCDGLKYVGSTNQTLNIRLSGHRYDKKKDHPCSSKQLNLDDCSITELEKCNEENRIEREKYWINKIDCVNVCKYKYNFDRKEYQKQYNKEYHKQHYEKNKDKKKEYDKQYYGKNKDKKKEYRENNKEQIKQQKQDKYIEKVVKNCLDDLIKQVEDLN